MLSSNRSRILRNRRVREDDTAPKLRTKKKRRPVPDDKDNCNTDRSDDYVSQK